MKKRKKNWIPHSRKEWIRLTIVSFLALLFFGLGLYTIEAARLVTSRMVELNWQLPSKVYGAAPILFPEKRMSIEEVESFLDRIGYLVLSPDKEPETGEWSRPSANELHIGLRSFRDGVDKLPPRTIRLVFEDGRIKEIYSKQSGERDLQKVWTLTLEPELIGEIFPSHREQRLIIKLGMAPQVLRDAILVMEDRAFYDHFGISLRGIARAFLSNLKGGRISQGGSTLTQQLMKNFFLTPERTISRKVKEAVMAIVAETLYSKDEILEAYLNEIYLGQRGPTSIHGFGEASRFYFSKSVQNLTVSEQATLAGLISSPGLYSPYRNPEAARTRRDLVLAQLFEHGKISEVAFQEAKSQAIVPRGKSDDSQLAPYFVDFIKSEVSEKFDEDVLTREGFEIFTNLDPTFQRAARSAISSILPELEAVAYGKKNKTIEGQAEDPDSMPLQVALVSMHPRTGALRAMVGGRTYKNSQFNRVTMAKRQPGSAMKPFIAAIALSPPSDDALPRVTLATILTDEPTTFSFSGKDWSPSNYEDQYFGDVTVRTAIEKSLNVATINLAAGIGIERLLSGLSEFGFESGEGIPSIVLGTLAVSPLQMAQAYTAFANGGLLANPMAIASVISPSGQKLEQRSPKFERVLSEEVAYMVTTVLQGVVERGTARSIRAHGLRGNYAGKTGTTNEYRDSWFVGYSPELLTVVWVGFDDNSPTFLTGASGALQVWIRYMRELDALSSDAAFLKPATLESYEIDPVRGCFDRHLNERLQEVFYPGTKPVPCP